MVDHLHEDESRKPGRGRVLEKFVMVGVNVEGTQLVGEVGLEKRRKKRRGIDDCRFGIFSLVCLLALMTLKVFRDVWDKIGCTTPYFNSTT